MAKTDIRSIAEACSVSVATVSRVFNGKEGVGEKVRNQVIETARKMGYAPKQAAAQHDVAIVIDPDEELLHGGYSFRSSVLTRLLYELFRHEFSLKTINFAQADLLLPGYAKTAILFLPEKKSVSVVKKLNSAKIPVVLVNHVIEGAFSVCTDHYKGVKFAIERFIAAGHGKIGLLLDNLENWAGRERLRAYEETMKKHRLTPHPVQVPRNGKSVVECVAALKAEKVTGLFVGGESIIEETVHMLGLLNISVPNDMSVISCEKERVSQWLNPPHTTVSQDLNEICMALITLMRDLCSKKKKDTENILLSSTLIERSSVKASSNAIVATQ